MQAALVVAILRKLAESEAPLHIGPTAFELVSHDTEQVAIAIRIDVAGFAVDAIIATSITP